MSKDADLIRRMADAYIGNELGLFENIEAGMARVLAVVREYEAPVAKRVPVQIATIKDNETLYLYALSNDGQIFVSDGDQWAWSFPPLPQSEDEP